AEGPESAEAPADEAAEGAAAQAQEPSGEQAPGAAFGVDDANGQGGMPGMAGFGVPGMDPAMVAAMAAQMGQGAYPSAAQQAAMAAHAQAYAAQQAQLQGMATGATFQPLAGAMPYPVDPRRIDLLREVIMGVSVELGRTRLTVQEILGLTPGSIVELDRAAGAPVDVLVNGTLIAHGEVVVVDEEFAVRISEVVGPDREGRITA
ncbi:putative flagellar motor switch protein FliY, partial [Kineosphaera limosa NBRC 100340]